MSQSDVPTWGEANVFPASHGFVIVRDAVEYPQFPMSLYLDADGMWCGGRIGDQGYFPTREAAQAALDAWLKKQETA